MHTSDRGSNSKMTGTYTSDGIFIPDRIMTPSELSRATMETAPAQKAVDISPAFTGEENSGFGANRAVVKQINPEWELDPTTGKKFYPLPIFKIIPRENNTVVRQINDEWEIDPATGKKFYPLPIFKIIPRENNTVVRQINDEWEIDPATGKKFYPLPIFGTFTGEENAYTPDAGLEAPQTGSGWSFPSLSVDTGNTPIATTGEENIGYGAAPIKQITDYPSMMFQTGQNARYGNIDDSLAEISNLYTAGPEYFVNKSKEIGLTPIDRTSLAAISGLEKGFGNSANAVETMADFLLAKIADISGMDRDEFKKLFYAQNGYPTDEAEYDELIGGDDLVRQANEMQSQAKEGVGSLGGLALDSVGMLADAAAKTLLSSLSGIPLAALYGIDTGGSAALDADQQGQSIEKQTLFGLSTGVLTGGIEALSGIGEAKVLQSAYAEGFSKLLDQLSPEVASSVKNTLNSSVARILRGAFGEGVEAFAQYDVDRTLKNIILGKEEPRDTKAQLYQTFISFVIGAFFQYASETLEYFGSGETSSTDTEVFRDESIDQKNVENSDNPSYNNSASDSDDLNADINKGAGETSHYFKDEQLKTEPNTAYFWSGNSNGIGGKDFAMDHAANNGGTTLEGLVKSQGIEMPTWDIADQSSKKAWEYASRKYAGQVSGDVHALIGTTQRPNSIWRTIELQELMKNPNVSKIILVDPETLTETVIFRR